MNIQQNKPGRPGKRSASNAGLPDMSPSHGGGASPDNGRHLSDLHLAASAATRLDHSKAAADESDDEELQIADEHLRGVMPGKGSVVGGRKSGSKNYAASEHKHFLFLVDRLQAWAEGPQGESWSEIAARQHKKLGYRRDPMVLHDHFMEMVNVARSVMRENGLTFPNVPEDPNLTEEQLAEHMDIAYLDLGEQLFLAFQNRTGKKLCPGAWWDADIFAHCARISNDMENNTTGAIQDAALLEQRRREIDFEERANEGSLMQARQSLLSSDGSRRSLGTLAPASSLKDDLAEIKQSSKLLRKFDDRLTKVEEKIDMIMKHLGVSSNA